VKRWLIFAVAVALYLPAVRYDFVQDDRVIVVGNPAVHSLSAGVHGFSRPYWPPPNSGGLYRPLTILSYAVDWWAAGGRPWLFHLMNALWHGLATLLVVLVLVRWLPETAALAAGLVFALHPVHVEAVAGIVGRAELLAAVGLLGAVVTARRGWWPAAVACASVAMFSKEHGVVAGILVLIDDWLRPPGTRRYPLAFYVVLSVVTVGFLGVWSRIGAAMAHSPHRTWKGCPLCKPHKRHGAPQAHKLRISELRRVAGRTRRLTRHDVGDWRD